MYYLWTWLTHLVHRFTSWSRIQTFVAIFLVGGQCALAFLLSNLFPGISFYVFLATVLLLFEFILETLIKLNTYGRQEYTSQHSRRPDASLFLPAVIRGIPWEDDDIRSVPHTWHEEKHAEITPELPANKIAAQARKYVRNFVDVLDAVAGEFLSVVFFVVDFSALVTIQAELRRSVA